MRGRLIVVEGLDGVGKTTVSRLLATELRAEWGTTPCTDARALRGIVDAWVDPARLLFYAASVIQAGQHYQQALNSGRDVVLDRYWLTTLAYACDTSILAGLEPWVLPADITLFVTLDEQERRRRLQGRGMTEADRLSLAPAPSLRAKYQRYLSHPAAGTGIEVNLGTRNPDEACRLIAQHVSAVHTLVASTRSAVKSPNRGRHGVNGVRSGLASPRAGLPQ